MDDVMATRHFIRLGVRRLWAGKEHTGQHQFKRNKAAALIREWRAAIGKKRTRNMLTEWGTAEHKQRK